MSRLLVKHSPVGTIRCWIMPLLESSRGHRRHHQPGELSPAQRLLPARVATPSHLCFLDANYYSGRV
jgi:hypothetical protein